MNDLDRARAWVARNLLTPERYREETAASLAELLGEVRAEALSEASHCLLRDARQDLAFAQRDHGVTIRRARRFEVGLGVVAAMLDPSHPAQDVIRSVLADPEDPATPTEKRR